MSAAIALALAQTVCLVAIVSVQQLQLRKLRYLIAQSATRRADQAGTCVCGGDSDTAGETK